MHGTYTYSYRNERKKKYKLPDNWFRLLNRFGTKWFFLTDRQRNHFRIFHEKLPEYPIRPELECITNIQLERLEPIGRFMHVQYCTRMHLAISETCWLHLSVTCDLY
jgi:hypothetical protein